MRDLDPDFLATLVAGKDEGLAVRQLVSVTGWTFPDSNGEIQPVTMSFWSDDDDIDITVVSQIDNQAETRTFYGGVNLDVGEIVRSTKLEVQTVTVSLSANAPVVEELVRGHDIRLAQVEIWDLLLDPKSLKPSGMAPAFLGVIDGSPISDQGENGEEIVEINVVNDLMVMLTRTNPAKSSDEEQKKRTGVSGTEDTFSEYAGSVKNWNIAWGEK